MKNNGYYLLAVDADKEYETRVSLARHGFPNLHLNNLVVLTEQEARVFRAMAYNYNETIAMSTMIRMYRLNTMEIITYDE